MVHPVHLHDHQRHAAGGGEDEVELGVLVAVEGLEVLLSRLVLPVAGQAQARPDGGAHVLGGGDQPQLLLGPGDHHVHHPLLLGPGPVPVPVLHPQQIDDVIALPLGLVDGEDLAGRVRLLLPIGPLVRRPALGGQEPREPGWASR